MIVKRIIMLLILCAVTIYVTGCPRKPDQSSFDKEPFITYRDIPGVTAQEISAIEALNKERDTFIYAMTLSTEAFLKGNNASTGDAGGESAVGGYAAFFCEWLTGLFGIRFQPEIYAWNDLLEKLNAGDLDFAGNIT
ncbi:MAG: hypothetical protein LBH97_03755, partial [Treponema sp.]|nr:hypothetical protein [Treponema sp.]